jgi:superfamily I DNA and RNA helicase
MESDNNSKETEIQNKVSEAVQRVSQSYERKLASISNQLVKIVREMADKDDYFILYEESVKETINQLKEDLNEANKQIEYLATSNLERDLEKEPEKGESEGSIVAT